MSESTSLVALLGELGAVGVEFHRTDGALAVVVVSLPEGRRLMAIERTYREGVRILVDPTPDELSTARDGDLPRDGPVPGPGAREQAPEGLSAP